MEKNFVFFFFVDFFVGSVEVLCAKKRYISSEERGYYFDVNIKVSWHVKRRVYFQSVLDFRYIFL